MWLGIIVGLSLFGADKKSDPNFQCPVAKEYIATYNYLVNYKELKLNQKEIESLARDVAKGCVNAAIRFSTTVDFLITAQMDSVTALRTGKDLALRQDGAAETFLTIFKVSYASDLLDLDLYRAMKNAQSLSLDLDAVAPWTKNDFITLAKYCVHRLEIPPIKCAELVTSVLATSAGRQDEEGKFSDLGVAVPFMEGIEFLTQNSDGPKIPRYQALELLEDLLKVSPYAFYEFRRIYHFAVTRSLQPLSRQEGLEMAKALSTYVQPVKIVKP